MKRSGRNICMAVMAAVCLSGGPARAAVVGYDFDSDQNHTGTWYTQAGWNSVRPNTLYAAGSQSYGWDASVGVNHRDRGAFTDPMSYALRDLHFGPSDRTFSVDVANGIYAVTIYWRDPSSLHDNIQVSAEGAVVLTDVDVPLSSAITTRSFDVTVVDHRLDITIHKNTGTDPNWIINGLTIEQIAAPEPATLALLALGWLGTAGIRLRRCR
ncbi:MAG: hypothetical protein BIFFINMI_01750 [Phycisphaerae bacterium]|nr:hypothetical protein [Phycisphaerae bacterium]